MAIFDSTCWLELEAGVYGEMLFAGLAGTSD
jgi:hypothetical protein